MSLLDMFGFSWVILDVDWLLFWILLRSSLGEASKDAISAPVKGQERSRVSMSSFLLGPSRHCFFLSRHLRCFVFPYWNSHFPDFSGWCCGTYQGHLPTASAPGWHGLPADFLAASPTRSRQTRLGLTPVLSWWWLWWWWWWWWCWLLLLVSLWRWWWLLFLLLLLL